jgi:uncharacterized membrane protein
MTEQEDLRDSSSRGARIAAFDLARGLALLFMVMTHVRQYHAAPDVRYTTYGNIVSFLGAPLAAPTFMFLMGASQAFSTRASLGRGVRRGLELIALGYTLNVLRGTLPITIGVTFGLITLDEIAPHTASSTFWNVDILQFAGTALVLLALIRWLLPSPVHWLFLSALVAVASPLLWEQMTGWPILDWILSLLWGGHKGVVFTVFPWLSYPLTGMAFGHWLATSTRRDVLFRRAILVAVCLAAAAAAGSYTDPQFPTGGYPNARPIIVAWIIGLVLAWICVCHVLTCVIPANPLFRLLFYWSENVTTFYYFQWLIICWAVTAIGYRQLILAAAIVSTIVVLLLSDRATRLWRRVRQRRT